MRGGVIIEAVSTGHPDIAFSEFVTLANNSNKKFNIDDWMLVWIEMPISRELHRYVFQWPNDHHFAPKEKLFLFSGLDIDSFYREGQRASCPIAHYRFYTDSQKHLCLPPHCKIILYDANGTEIDNRYLIQGKEYPQKHPSIAIGHGRNLAWRDLRDHLRDQQGFAVEAFETEPRAGNTIPDVIVGLGDKSNMAILVLTGEDLVMADNGKGVEENLYPRLNVIQELGKFQERFGRNKTIILVEKGVTVPSNNSGIVHLSFEPEQIKSTFGDVVAAIRKEFKL